MFDALFARVSTSRSCYERAQLFVGTGGALGAFFLVVIVCFFVAIAGFLRRRRSHFVVLLRDESGSIFAVESESTLRSVVNRSQDGGFHFGFKGADFVYGKLVFVPTRRRVDG